MPSMITKLVTYSANLGIFHRPIFESQVLLQWHYNELDGVSNHQPASRVFVRAQIKENQSSTWTILVKGIHLWHDGSPSQRTSHAENISICWRHHDIGKRQHISLFKTQHKIMTEALSFWIHAGDTMYVVIGIRYKGHVIFGPICVLFVCFLWCFVSIETWWVALYVACYVILMTFVRCYFAVLHKPSNLFSA